MLRAGLLLILVSLFPTGAWFCEMMMGPMEAGAAVPGIRLATRRDRAAVERLLESADLPTAGVAEALERFVVAERPAGAGSGPVLEGVAGLEVHGGDGVLRSVVVAESARGTGLGARLTERVIEGARAEGLRRLYLLTTTAADYFPRHGFRRIDRAEASAAVRESVEFREACPASAVAMVLEL